jgi:hypothetical protein
MYVIEIQNNQRRWISAIFQDEEAAKQYYESLSEGIKTISQIYAIPYSNYPIYLIEDKHFSFVSQQELRTRLQSISRVENNDWVYFNIYTITKDYASEAGRDRMGILEHSHVDNDYLTRHKI